MNAQELMFCFQCQEASKGIGCTIKGVCGKEASTSAYMDLLIYSLKGISILSRDLRNANIKSEENTGIFIVEALFSTITNANFDDESIKNRIVKAFEIRESLKATALTNGINVSSDDIITWPADESSFAQKAKEVGVLSEKNIDIRSLKELIIYGLKGMAAYIDHAHRLGFEDASLYDFMEDALAKISIDNLDAEALTTLVLETGKAGVSAMALLDKANTTKYGHPEITKVNIGVGKNPGILISGHDLHDIEDLLKQTEGTGVDVYTHSEMLPAHYYPAFKKYKHFVGNYGNAWWKQREEFSSFNGPIVFTTNCIVPPLKDSSYKNRMFTSNATGFPGCKHIETDENGHKDYSEVIALAKNCPAPTEIETGHIIGGFAHNQVFQLADKVVDAVKTGAIRQFIVMGGCDGRMKGRDYYSDFAQALPKDTVILTAGCAKYRYNKLALGDINGIPRVLDAGQCNDSYSLAVIALKLKEIFQLNDINELPITYNIAWYEQKAVIVLLALLYLGVKNIHLGPTLPAFLSPNVTKVLVDNFGISTISSVEEDLKKFGLVG